jgi:hypothetical protein
VPGFFYSTRWGSNMMLAVQPRRILSRPKHLFALILVAAAVYWLLVHRSNTGYHVARWQGGDVSPLVGRPPGSGGQAAQKPLKGDSSDGKHPTDEANGDSNASEESADSEPKKYQTAEEKKLEEEREAAEKALRNEFENEYKVLSK